MFCTFPAEAMTGRTPAKPMNTSTQRPKSTDRSLTHLGTRFGTSRLETDGSLIATLLSGKQFDEYRDDHGDTEPEGFPLAIDLKQIERIAHQGQKQRGHGDAPYTTLPAPQRHAAQDGRCDRL